MSEAQRAYSLRVNWMRRMGLDAAEILEDIERDPPRSVDEEMKQIQALDKLDRMKLSSDAWRKIKEGVN